MRLLLDTLVLLWAAEGSARLSPGGRKLIAAMENELFFSAASIWEIAIKSALGREDFEADPGMVREALLENGYRELAVAGNHAAAVAHLPPVHKDPFDRLLVAQAMIEGMILVTADAGLTHYPGTIRRV